MMEALDEIYEEAQMMMEDSVEAMKRHFKTLRTGKVEVSILDNVRVDYYGAPTPLAQVATVLAVDATTISVNPWEKHILPDVEKAISQANIGVNPNNDGEIIKLFFPAMTSDQRQEVVKKAKGQLEDAKVSIRNNRKHANDAIKKLEKEKEITQDDSKAAQDEIQKYTDKYVGMLESVFKEKEADILKV
jgi:ribosome recycling factor